jgi:hypothetical protein
VCSFGNKKKNIFHAEGNNKTQNDGQYPDSFLLSTLVLGIPARLAAGPADSGSIWCVDAGSAERNCWLMSSRDYTQPDVNRPPIPCEAWKK